MRRTRKERKGHSEGEFVKGIRIFLLTAIGWFLASTASELIGEQAGALPIGQAIGKYALTAGVVLGPVILVVVLVLYLRGRRRERDEVDIEPVVLPEPVPWDKPDPLFDRDTEVRRAVQLVLAHRLVVVAGPRDIGTTAVAESVVQSLIERHDAEPAKTVRFDLRGRSTHGPDDARTTAARMLSALELDEPADDTPEVLANAARRLIRMFDKHYHVLLLDNVSAPEQVSWLVREWPAAKQRLVLAGEAAIGAMVPDRTVQVGELDLPGLRSIWDAELTEPARRHWIASWLLRGLRGPSETDDVDDLLKSCFGRPRAVKAFAQEIRRPGSTVTVESLLQTVRSAGPVDGQLERVWTAILDHIRDGLSTPAVWLLHALAELPVTALTSGAINALLARHGVEEGTDPLEELRIRNLVLEAAGRYRMPTEIRRALVGTTQEPGRRAVALEAIPALLRHHVELTAIGSPDPTQRWFHDEERSLRLFFGPETYADERLLAMVLEDLARIADALEAWYVREQQSSGMLTVNQGLHTLADRAGRPDLASLSAIRTATAHRMAGRLGEAGAQLTIAAELTNRLTDSRVVAELHLREHVERALLGMTGVLDQEALRNAEVRLNQLLARSGTPGGMIALLNLGALCLQQGRSADARVHLRRAEKMARDNGDIGCEAHAIELQGVAVSQQALNTAVEHWQRAKERFTRIGEEQGEARCLQHLGSAALVDPKVAGQLRDGRPAPLDDRAAAEVALPLLRRSKKLRAGQPDTKLVDHYLEMARDRLGLTSED
ncbi:MAG: hypothetical protein ABW215_15525 [Kibdelosporangium sp.]